MNTGYVNSTANALNARLGWLTWGGLQFELPAMLVIVNQATPEQLDQHLKLVQETMEVLDVAASRAAQVKYTMQKYGLSVAEAVQKLAVLDERLGG